MSKQMTLLLCLFFLFICPPLSAGDKVGPRPGPAQDKAIDVELKLTMPGPMMNGYFMGVSGNLGVQWRKMVALEFRGGMYAMDIFGIGYRHLAADVGLVPTVSDKRVGHRGWVHQLGPSLGYLYESGEGGDSEGYWYYVERYHYVTGNLVYKATHWWRKHIGFVFQIRLIGAASVHHYYHKIDEEYDPDYDDSPTAEFSSGYQFGYQKRGGVRMSLGLAF